MSPVAPPAARGTGSELGVGEPHATPKPLTAHRRPRRRGCLGLPLNTSSSPSLGHPARHPALTRPGTRRPWLAPPPPPPGRAGPGRPARPASPRRPQPVRASPEAVSATGGRHAPRPEAGGRRGEREAGRREAAAGERAAAAGSAPAPYTALAVEPAAPAPGEERDI